MTDRVTWVLSNTDPAEPSQETPGGQCIVDV